MSKVYSAKLDRYFGGTKNGNPLSTGNSVRGKKKGMHMHMVVRRELCPRRWLFFALEANSLSKVNSLFSF